MRAGTVEVEMEEVMVVEVGWSVGSLGAGSVTLLRGDRERERERERGRERERERWSVCVCK